MSKVYGSDSNSRKAGPLEQTWIERHRKRDDCKCDLVRKEGFVTYVCIKCGREI